MPFPLCDVTPAMAIEAAKILVAIMATIEVVKDDGHLLTFTFHGPERLLERLAEFGASNEDDEPEAIEDDGRGYPRAA